MIDITKYLKAQAKESERRAVKPLYYNGEPVSINDAKGMVKQVGEHLIPGFTVDDSNKQAYTFCTLYFMGAELSGEYKLRLDADNVNVYQYSPAKGVLVVGSTSTGKSDMLKVFGMFSRVTGNGVSMVYNHCLNIEDNYKTRGTEYLLTFNQRKNYVFDDIGQEGDPGNGFKSSHFKDEVVVMERVLNYAYENWKRYGVVTFATTNLNGEELLQRYGKRVFERIGEMYNIIVLTGKNRRINERAK